MVVNRSKGSTKEKNGEASAQGKHGSLRSAPKAEDCQSRVPLAVWPSSCRLGSLCPLGERVKLRLVKLNMRRAEHVDDIAALKEMVATIKEEHAKAVAEVRRSRVRRRQPSRSEENQLALTCSTRSAMSHVAPGKVKAQQAHREAIVGKEARDVLGGRYSCTAHAVQGCPGKARLQTTVRGGEVLKELGRLQQ